MIPGIQLPDGGVVGGPSMAGALGENQIAELQKALTASYETDVAQLSGGGALRIQSLDKTMMATVQENKHFRLFNALRANNATATVDEWTEQSEVGGHLGGSAQAETGTINEATGVYNRRVGFVKYLMTRRQVSFVSTLGNNITSPEAAEQTNGAKQLLSDAEFLMFEGDSDVVSFEFDGIAKQLEDGVTAGVVDSNNIVDALGKPLTGVDSLNTLAAQIAGYGNFGTPTDLYMSLECQADFDTALDPAFRVPLPDVPGGGIQIGAPVVGIRTSHGNIKTNPDVFIRDQKQLTPFQVRHSVLATANTGMKPSVAISAATDDATAKFTADKSGNYYYLITGLNEKGESDGAITAQTAVATGKKVVLTITASGGGAETGYAIYRSRLNGTNAPDDFRLIKRIPRTASETVFTDRNWDIPGTTKAFVLNLTPGDQAINWRQMLPMLRFPLYPTVSAVIPWAQLMFGYLRITKRRHHGMIKNILPACATWRPFGV